MDATCNRQRICEDPSFVASCASVGIEHGRSTGQMMLNAICRDCPLRPPTPSSEES
jgi:hypothetical protein